MNEVPEKLPRLLGGKGAPGSGQVCAEQAVNWLVSGRIELGDETDHPSCVQPVLNKLAIHVNDALSDAGAYAAAANAAFAAANAAGTDARDDALLSMLRDAQAECERLTNHVAPACDVSRLERLGELVGIVK